MAIEVKAIACELPSRLDLPLSRLNVPDIKAEVIRRGIVASISGSTIWRWLDDDAIRPWTFRSWIFPRDPAFEAKAGRVLDLYGRRFEGKALGCNDFVVSADEKPSIQARCRCHPSLPPAAARAMRVEHEYDRGGPNRGQAPGSSSSLPDSSRPKYPVSARGRFLFERKVV